MQHENPQGLLRLTPMMLFAASSALYLFPLLLGEGEGRDAQGRRVWVWFDPETVFVATLILLLVAIAALAYPAGRRPLFPRRHMGSIETLVVLILWGSTFLYILATPDLFAVGKSFSLEATNRLHLLFYDLSILAVVAAWMAGPRRNKLMLIAGVCGLLLAMFIGHRSYMAIAFISMAFVSFRDRSIFKIKLRYILMALLILVALVAYKSVYQLVKAGQYDLAYDRLFDSDYLQLVTTGFEPLFLAHTLDTVIYLDYQPACNDIWLGFIVLFTLFLNEVTDFGACEFNTQFQTELFPGVEWGMGSNIWAEFFSNYGYPGLMLVIFLVFLMSSLFEKAIKHVQSPILAAGFVAAIVQVTFYIQRNSFSGAMTLCKRLILVAFIVWAGSSILRFFLRAWVDSVKPSTPSSAPPS